MDSFCNSVELQLPSNANHAQVQETTFSQWTVAQIGLTDFFAAKLPASVLEMDSLAIETNVFRAGDEHFSAGNKHLEMRIQTSTTHTHSASYQRLPKVLVWRQTSTQEGFEGYE